MKKNIKKVKKFQKLLICFLVIFATLFGIAVGKFMNTNADEINYEYQSSNISYDSTSNSLNADNVKDAIDELYSKVGQCPTGFECLSEDIIEGIDNTLTIIGAYKYNENNDGNICITGEEEKCKKSICYLSKTLGACTPGTIIDYKVNDTEIVRFHVLHDDGKKMTLQTQKTIIKGVKWNSTEGNHKSGPVVAMNALKNLTDSWNNAEPILITSGMNEFDGGISSNNNCTRTYCISYDGNSGYDYSTIAGTYNARLITVIEANNVGCLDYNKSCPVYMMNFLSNSAYHCPHNGMCTNDSGGGNNAYWTMGAPFEDLQGARRVSVQGYIDADVVTSYSDGIRAVIVVNK